MKSRRLFAASLLLFLIGLSVIVMKWHGSYTASLAFPLSTTSIQISGSASGALVFAGVLVLFLGFILLIGSIIAGLAGLKSK